MTMTFLARIQQETTWPSTNSRIILTLLVCLSLQMGLMVLVMVIREVGMTLDYKDFRWNSKITS